MKSAIVYGGPKRPDLYAALARGWGAKLVDSRTASPVRCTEKTGALHIIGGLQHGSLELLREIRAAREDYLFVDRAYFLGGPGSLWFRVVPRGYQHNRVRDVPPDRAAALKLAQNLAPLRANGRHILLVPPSQAICALFGLGDWEAETLARLKACTERPVDVSRKGDPRPLAERLKDCHAVVTWTSNVAVEAVCAGVPVFVSSESAAYPVGERIANLEARIETPRFEPDRQAWLNTLACGQWTLDEIARGEARAHLSMRGEE